MGRTTCPSQDQLEAFQLGNLPEASLDEVAAHLEQCPHCETLAQHLDTTVDPVLAAIRNRATHEIAVGLVTRALGPQAITVGHEPREEILDSGSFSFFRPPQQADEIGRLGNYRVLRLLGRGGMAFVFAAEDLTLGRSVALKVMKPDLGPESEVWQRFLRETGIMAAIKHENLITVFQVGQEAGVGYLTMELLQGESLADRLDRAGPPDVAETLRLARELTTGLAVIHRHGLVHRDLKPANIWLEAIPRQAGDSPSPRATRVKILDFGLARSVNEDTNLTRTGMIMGTPTFMSPEQVRGQKADARSDLFSLGCILYCLAAGVKPFEGNNTLAVLTALALHNPRPVHELNPAIPEALSALIMELLAKDADERPASAEELAERLREIQGWLADRPNTSTTARIRVHKPAGDAGSVRPAPAKKGGRRRWKVLVAVLVLGALTIAGWMILPQLLPLGRWTVYPVVPDAVYLSRMDVIDSTNWPFGGWLPGAGGWREPTDWPPPQGGHRVRVKKKVSLHGIFMHLPPFDPQVSSVSYHLGKRFDTFSTSVSLNDGPLTCAPMVFAVYGDGRLLWRSKPVQSQADTQTCKELSVKGVDQLTLELTGSGKGSGTQGVWIEPYLTERPRDPGR